MHKFLMLFLVSAAFAQQGPTVNAGRFTASVYSQFTLHSMNVVGATSTTMSIDVCYPTFGTNVQAFFPLATNAPLLIIDAASSETVTPSQVNAPHPTQYGDLATGPYACSFVATFTKPHFVGVVLTSATGGLQEAINDANNKGGGIVVIDNTWKGNTAIITTTIKGFTSVAIEDTRSGDNLYNWNGSNYALNPGGGGVTPGSPCGDSSHALSWNGVAYGCQSITGSAQAGGNPGQIEYNNAGALDGISGFSTDGANNVSALSGGVLDLHLGAGFLFPGVLSSGLVKNTTTTGVVSIVAAPAGAVVGTSDTQALTNKDLTGAGNTFPTFNQNTTGTAARWTTARLLAGNSVSGTANVPFANAFIVQGTTDTGLSGAQFLGALGTGLLKNTTTTGVLSLAASADVYGLFTSCTGSSGLFMKDGGTCAAPPGSGTINSGTTNGIAYYTGSAALSSTTPPTANGIYYDIENVTGSASVAPTHALGGVPTNAQVGTTYTVGSANTWSDRSTYVTFSNGSSIAVTLPQANTTGFTSNWVAVFCDIGAATATVTPTTSTISYTDGSTYTSAASSMPLKTGQCASIYSDNTNYFAIIRGGGAVTLDQLGGSAAQATKTETAVNHEYTFAGVETANLTSYLSITDANSSNNNSNGALIVGTTGTSTGAVPFRINEATVAGDLLDAWTGGTVTNGVLSGGNKQFVLGKTGSTFQPTDTIGSGGTTQTISADNGAFQTILLSANLTISFTQPTFGNTIIRLKITQAAGGSDTVTWTSVKWPGAIAPVMTAAANAVDWYSCLLDGTNTYCTAGQNFQ